MSNFLSPLSASARARLLEELNYLNLEEIRGFCSARGIPYRIMAESADGKVKARPPRTLIESRSCWPMSGVISQQGKSVSPLASPRRLSARRGHRRGPDLAIALLSLVREGVRGCDAIAS
jgi:hypothetical protein